MNLTTVSPQCAPFSWLPTPLCSEDSFLFCAGVLRTRQLTVVSVEIFTLLNFPFKAS